MNYTVSYLCILCLLFQNGKLATKESGQGENIKPSFYTPDDFKKLEKYDVHVHINTNAGEFVQQAREDNFRLITINLDDSNEPPPMEIEQQFALARVKAFPARVSYATTFSVIKFNDDDWLKQQLLYLKHSFSSGAVAVKIYKVIGMSLRDKAGKLVMIDDPRFDPIFDFI